MERNIRSTMFFNSFFSLFSCSSYSFFWSSFCLFFSSFISFSL